MKTFRSLLAGLLLFAFALPVAAVDETPAPAPEAVLYSVTDPVPCSAEIAAAVANGSGPGAVFEACLLPDGTLLPVNAMTRAMPGASAEPCSAEVIAAADSGQVLTDVICLLPDGSLYAPAVRGVTGGDGVDVSGDYASWLEEFKAGLEACPEGTDPTDMSVMTCLLPDGTIAGPVPMFAGAPEMIEDVSAQIDGATDTDEADNSIVFLGAMLLAAGAALIVALRRRTA